MAGMNQVQDYKRWKRRAYIYWRTIAPGTSTITGKIGDKEYSFKVIVKPYMGAKMSSVKAVDYKSVKVTWQKANAATVGTHTFKQ